MEVVFNKEDLITTVMVYWPSETCVSSPRHYHATGGPGMALAHDRQPSVEDFHRATQYKGEVWLYPRKWAERYYNLKRLNAAEQGGHFAPPEQSELLVEQRDS